MVLLFTPTSSQATVVDEGPNGILIAAVAANGALAITGAVLDGIVLYDVATDQPSQSGLRWGTGIVGGLNLLGGTMMLVVGQQLAEGERAPYFALGTVQLAIGAGGIILSILAESDTSFPDEVEGSLLVPWVGPDRDGGWQGGVSWTVSRW